MATYLADQTIPPLIHHLGYVRNGKAPDGKFMRDVVSATNHISAFRKKHIYTYGRDLAAIPAASGSSRSFGAGYNWTGYNATRLEFHVGMMKTTTVAASSRVKIVVIRESDASTQTLYFTWAGIFTGGHADTPEKIRWMTQGVAVNANEAYTFQITEENSARAVAVNAYEVGKNPVDTSDAGIVDANIGGNGATILDDDHQSLVQNHSLLWQKNGAVLAWYSFDTTPFSTAATSYVNLIDRAATAVAATSPGFSIDLRYHAVKSQTTVPVRIACYAQRTAGTGSTADNRIRFVNSAGNAVGITGIGNTGQWYTADGTLPIGSGADKYDFQVQTASGDTVAFLAATVISYE